MHVRSWSWAVVMGLALLAGGALAGRAQAGIFGPRVVVVPSSGYVVAPTAMVVSSPVVVPGAVTTTTYVTPAPVVETRAVYVPSATVVSSPVVTTGYAVPAAPVVVRPAPVRYVVPRTWYVLP